MRSSRRLPNMTKNNFKGRFTAPLYFLPTDTGKLFEMNEHGVGIEQIEVGSLLCGDSEKPLNLRNLIPNSDFFLDINKLVIYHIFVRIRRYGKDKYG